MQKNINNTSCMPQENSLISIILPTFNRKSFLKEAIQCIASQSYQNWELICIDDGSDDGSYDYLFEITRYIENNVEILQQTNSGPAEARNAGIKVAQGAYFAFFDSDDKWKPFHLEKLLTSLQNNEEVDWVYSACERIDRRTNTIVLNSTFYAIDGNPNPLFDVSNFVNGLYIIDTNLGLELQLSDGIDSGLQNSLVKKEIFQRFLIPHFRIGEDRLLIAKVLATGFKMAFIDEVTVEYYIHDNNSSVTNINADWRKKATGMEQLILSYEAYEKEILMSSKQSSIYRKKLTQTIFWEYGYAILKMAGQRKLARGAFWRGIKYSPMNLKLWKTLIVNEVEFYIEVFSRKVRS
jgi:glycosyltransferase involved in cell wall biosynthesis